MPLLGPLLTLLALVALALWLRDAVEVRLIYKPDKVLRRSAAEAGVPFEEVWLTAADGVRLLAWWFPKPGAIGTLLFCHGNTGNIGDRLWLVEDLRDFPVNVLLVDYRGYGRSGGRPSLRGTRLDLLAAHDFVVSRHGGNPNPPLVVWGRSLGGAIAARLCAERPPRGLILECTFTSIAEMGRRFYPWMLAHRLSANRYDTLALVPGMRFPKLFAHSVDDRKIPLDLGRKLFDAAAEPKSFFPLRGTHSEAGWRTTPEYRAEFERFVRDCLKDG